MIAEPALVEIEKMWRAGSPASEIAAFMTNVRRVTVTRNAVIGAMRRRAVPGGRTTRRQLILRRGLV